MSERNILISELAAEVLGPRRSVREELAPEEDPLNEFLLGVLSPVRSQDIAPDALEELTGAQDLDSDESESNGSPDSPGVTDQLLSPSFDPRCRPASLGISFVVESADANPEVDLCFTWARYRPTERTGWQRFVSGEVLERVSCDNSDSRRSATDSAVRLVVRSRKVSRGSRVSVFLVNETDTGTDRPLTEHHLFQPQIRVVCRDGTRICPLEEVHTPGASLDEQTRLSFLYRSRVPYARGHLCSAVWKEIDPELILRTESTPLCPPFCWIDGAEIFPPEIFERFALSDLRSEYIPCILSSAADPDWDPRYPPPELDPEKLSECWTSDAIHAALSPLAAAYEQWIKLGRQSLFDIGDFPAGQKVGTDLLDDCKKTHARILKGIDKLESNEEARLAFCFANKAIARQSMWTKGRLNSWRPFQLAFLLLNIPAFLDVNDPDRLTCDLLWFPTGGGKTEAYLGLAAFVMGLRRLVAAKEGATGSGVSVLSRYTLRLLTIQQFRRALALITACEVLRIMPWGSSYGWRPDGAPVLGEFLWGTERFSVGLWVGGNVTPNNLQTFNFVKKKTGKVEEIAGAISILQGRFGQGEPAQILSCPLKECSSILAVPAEGFSSGESKTLHVVIQDVDEGKQLPSCDELSSGPFKVTGRSVSAHDDRRFATVSLTFRLEANADPGVVDKYFADHVCKWFGEFATVASARASRPGYFLRVGEWKKSRRPYDFEIFCPNPECELNRDIDWQEKTPSGNWPVHPAFANATGNSSKCPIPAWTVDEQVYHRCPTMVIATVDKFARLSYEPKAAGLFGNVDRYSPLLGYYRTYCPPRGPDSLSGPPKDLEVEAPGPASVPVSRFRKPELILQDELHLIEGPLGSMVGLYEVAIDLLCSQLNSGAVIGPKYIASTATVTRAADQVRCLYDRGVAIFPPPGITIDDSFFAKTPKRIDPGSSGKVYVGLAAPGRGSLTPIVHCWSRVLQTVHDRRTSGVDDATLDSFWTLVGYFNAIRELAGAQALCNQDIPLRMQTIAPDNRKRPLDHLSDISSRANSLSLPGLLDGLNSRLGGGQMPVDIVLTTSMFGTGVDVERLGLMFVTGQPKTTSSYIQATGRVGRAGSGLVFTMLNAARPRDLNQYEFFAAFHRALYRSVEPATVNPFSPRARDRALGPVIVAILRQAAELLAENFAVSLPPEWRFQQKKKGAWECAAWIMAGARNNPEIEELAKLFERRAQRQAGLRRPRPGATLEHTQFELDRWRQVAASSRDAGQCLLYAESSMASAPSHAVVLGDLRHLVEKLGVAFEDAPNSLREVEATTTFQGWS